MTDNKKKYKNDLYRIQFAKLFICNRHLCLHIVTITMYLNVPVCLNLNICCTNLQIYKNFSIGPHCQTVFENMWELNGRMRKDLKQDYIQKLSRLQKTQFEPCIHMRHEWCKSIQVDLDRA